MAAKKKYVPGKAIERNRISIEAKRTINPAHLAHAQIGVELGLGALMDRKGFDRHAWTCLEEMSNILAALDHLYYDGRDFVAIRDGQRALKNINHRFLQRKQWLVDAVELEQLQLIVAIYHEVIRKTTYNQLAAACDMVEKIIKAERS